MAEMTSDQLTDYLKQVSTLETSVYQQIKVRKEARKQLVMPPVFKQECPKPPAFEEPTAPNAPGFGKSILKNLWAFIIGGAPFIYGTLTVVPFLNEDYRGPAFLIILAFTILFLCLGFFLAKRHHQEQMHIYEHHFAEYEDERAKAKEAHKKALASHAQQQAEIQDAYNIAKEHAKRKLENAKQQVMQLDLPLNEARQLLQKLYDADIIFPKYRNLVAMCTMYEYFVSGRCTELTGPSGAYNLYEAELRQNLIINQLEYVNENLEQIKQNQYVLYQGISETNKALRVISRDVQNILNAAEDIAISSRITAYCSEITAVNSRAQLYLEALN